MLRSLVLASALLGSSTLVLADGHLVTRTVTGSFADVAQDVEDAIIGQGLKIDYRAKVARMLSRTAKDLGVKAPPYKNGVVFQFCAAALSHQLMGADPLNIAYCPYRVFVYEPAATPERVTIGFVPLPAQTAKNDAARQAMERINALLTAIVGEAAGQ